MVQARVNVATPIGATSGQNARRTPPPGAPSAATDSGPVNLLASVTPSGMRSVAAENATALSAITTPSAPRRSLWPDRTGRRLSAD